MTTERLKNKTGPHVSVATLQETSKKLSLLERVLSGYVPACLQLEPYYAGAVADVVAASDVAETDVVSDRGGIQGCLLKTLF